MDKCIACGEELSKVKCIGTIGGISVSFCDEDALMCENCETITCKITTKS